jgi:hypothetical protein
MSFVPFSPSAALDLIAERWMSILILKFSASTSDAVEETIWFETKSFVMKMVTSKSEFGR